MRTLDHNNSRHKFLIALMALFVIPISGISTDIYVPSLPAVSHYFNVDKSLTQLTLTAYMLGIGIMQLFAGGIIDSFGRKKPFLWAMLIYIFASFCITISTDIYQLLFLRLVQGVAIAVTVVSMRSIIPDLFEGKAFYKMMSYMTIAWSIGPIIAPAIGGYLQHYYGWKANFYFLSGYSFIGFILILLAMPETTPHKHQFDLKVLLNRYKEFLLCWEYVAGVAINGLLYSLVILFSVVGPFLIQNIMHYSAIDFGYAALSIGLAWFLGATSNRFLINIDLQMKTTVCLWSVFIISLIMLIESLLFPMTLYGILVPLFFMTWFAGIVFPNYFAKGMALFPKTTGSANALFGGLLFIIIGVSTAFGALLKSDTQLPLVLSYIGSILSSMVIFYIGKRVKPVSEIIRNK